MKTFLGVGFSLVLLTSTPADAAKAPKPLWANTIALVSTTFTPAVDADGNSYVVGSGLSVFKFNRNGRILWSTNLADGVNAKGLSVDGNGNLFVTGSRADHASSPTNFSDIFTFKFSPKGELLWQRTYDPEDHTADFANEVAADGDGNAYVVGRSYEVTIPGSYSTVLKYSPDGTLLWARRHAGSTNSGAINTGSMALDPSGGVAAIVSRHVVSYAANGDFRWAWDGPALEMGAFDPAGNLLTGFPVVKISPTGQILWTASYTNPAGAAFESYPLDLKVDGLGNSFLALDSPVRCIFDDEDQYCDSTPTILKFDPSGQLLWSSRFSLPTNTFGEARGLAVNAEGESVLTARLKDTAVSAPSYGLVAKCDSSGNQIWSATYRVSDTEHGDFFFQRLALAPHDRVVIYSELPFANDVTVLGYRATAPGHAPRVLAAPASQTVALGATLTFEIVADGNGRFQYQWFFNGTPIMGANASTLVLPAVQFAQAGDYSVEVRNRAGAIVTPAVRLTVQPP